MKRYLCLAFVALIATPIIFGHALASAEGNSHPVCATGIIVDQPPYSGLSVTATHSGTMWIKIATEHVQVVAVSAGETYGPDTLSGWPRNKNGKPQQVSHVDYCPPTTETTTTTWPTTTVTTSPTTTTPATTSSTQPPASTTTAPEATSTSTTSTTSTPVTSSVTTTSLLPPVTVRDCAGICTPATINTPRTPQPDVCYIDNGPVLQPGNYDLTNISDATGSTYSGQPCTTQPPTPELCINHDTRETTSDYRIVQDGTANASTTRTFLPCAPATATSSTRHSALPSTGTGTQTVLTLAAVIIFSGVVLVYVRRRNR